MNDEEILAKAIINLFEHERFYAEIILQMERKIGKKVPTAGVCVKDRIELHVNPEFFNKLSESQQVAILKHEAQHILLGHQSRSKILAPEIYKKSKKDIVEDAIANMKHKILNISADLAINSHLRGLPEDTLHPQQFDLESGQTMEWYLEKLKKNEKAKDFMNFDDHAIWSESEGDADTLREKIRQAIEKAAANAKAAGRLSGDAELLVDQFNNSKKNWREELKRFAVKNMEYTIDTSRKKRNRRYGIQFPGIVKTEVLHIGIAIDTSGSISNDQLIQFMSEIDKISKYANITIVEADSEIKNVYKYDPKKKYTIKGRGGTAYQPAFDYFNKNEDIDGLIYFGDMDAYDYEEIKKPKYPVLWAIVGDQKPPVAWGSKIIIST